MTQDLREVVFINYRFKARRKRPSTGLVDQMIHSRWPKLVVLCTAAAASSQKPNLVANIYKHKLYVLEHNYQQINLSNARG